MEGIWERLHALEQELTDEVHRVREGRGYHLEGRRVWVEAAIRRAHHHRRTRVRRFLDYGDAEGDRVRLEQIRSDFADLEARPRAQAE